MKENVIITLKDICVAFDGETILNNLNLDIKDGEFVTILGPSGCGKTTTLRIIAGFQEPDSGEVIFDNQVMNGVPAHKRRVNTIFQRYALFPHLNVYENIAFGLRLRKMKEDAIQAKVKEMLALVDLKGFERRSIDSLSGGQQQRVAIARALAVDPEVLLLDEPLGALDLNITFIYVTHDQEEALSMSDKVIVMDGGEIQHIGTPEDIYNEPANAFVADFIGESNILDGIMLSDCRVRFSGHDFDCVDKGFDRNEPVDVVIRPEDVDICEPEDGMLTGVITSVTFKGLHYEIIVDINDFKWMIQTTDFSPEGATIGILIKPDEIHIMKKSKYSGEFGDYSSFSDEMDYISNAELDITDLDDITEVEEDE